VFKIYSKWCEYALRVLTQVEPEQADKNFLARELCRKAKVPEHSARKVLQMLVEAGYLDAVSGPGGGYKLKRSPESISLLDIIKTIDGDDVFNRCIMGLPQCGSANPCPAHNLWAKVKDGMLKEMQKQVTH
jgi:Rrf2 family protein